MTTIVGLFESDENVQSSIDKLKGAGVTEAKVIVVPCNDAGRERLDIAQHWLVAKYAGWGAVIGIAIAGSFGLATGLSALTIYGFGLTFTISMLIVFSLIGAALGGLFGAFMGVDALEKINQLFREGIGFGGELEIVQAADELAFQAMGILQKTEALAMEIYPEIEEGS